MLFKIPCLQTLTVQLQRNWNSRLGFSLNSDSDGTVISAIHADSVAAKDGRLQVNDKIIEVCTIIHSVSYIMVIMYPRLYITLKLSD